LEDTRIHLVLYFSSDWSEYDFENLKILTQYSNVIPIIGQPNQGANVETIFDLKSTILRTCVEKQIDLLEIDSIINVIF
jgi:septin family protein